jgi:hypothetical protein
MDDLEGAANDTAEHVPETKFGNIKETNE